MNEYLQQAKDFCDNTGTTIKKTFLKHDYYFEGDDNKRDVYYITISRPGKGLKDYSFQFGNSVAHSHITEYKRKAPTHYDILACLTKYPVDTFENFCADYGCDVDSIKAHKTYLAVKEEWENVNRMFSDVLEQLQEIQ